MTGLGYWAVDSEHGQELCSGLQSYELGLRAAQSHAERIGAPVYLYEVGSDDEPEEVAL